MQMSLPVTKQRRELVWLFLYILLLHITWTVCRLFLIPPLQQALGNPWNMVVEAFFKILLWVVPVFIYITIVLKTDPLSYLKLKTDVARGLLWGLIGCVLPLLQLLSALFVRHDPLQLTHSASEWLNTVVLVGLIEEIPFRGLLFQELHKWLNFWQASILSSFFFVTIHLPLWIITGQTASTTLLSNVITVFILGIIFAYLLKLSRSLWSSILMHTIYDLVATLL